ncbi:Hypothetical predicted protein [Lynx pardinus]|uniref:Ig-like domain-containing protein n=1 Tax=Lynx pardinus TaxID=191816 RepID=A0A485MLU1_LYNPA|nr:Hypothetical predicted protein [Lynx pardinus]
MKLIMLDERPVENISPKPTIFLPSIAERKLHKTGTYLCLLEDFFPGVIEIYWKEKNGKTILESQQGNTMKTKDTYMKYTWLTVSEESMGKEHKCVVKHDSNKGGVDQEILFPSIDKGESIQPRSLEMYNVTPLPLISPSLSKEQVKLINGFFLDALHLHLVNNSAYYTYLLLLLKSMVYSAIITVNLLGKPTLFGNGKSS